MNNLFLISKQDTFVIKGIAIIAMLCHHVYQGHPTWIDTYPSFLTAIGVLGKVCVALFLFCSGYGLAVQYEKILLNLNTFKEKLSGSIIFVTKRLLKFYSAYWFVFLIFVPISICFFHISLPSVYGENVNLFKRLFLDFLGLQGFQSFTFVWWFNKLIILLYLLFPLLYWFIKETKWMGLVTGFILLLATNLKIPNYYDMLLWQFPFIIGVGWNMYQDKMIKVSNFVQENQYLCIGFAIFLFFLCVFQRLYNIIPYGDLTGIRFDAFLSLSIVLLVLLIVRRLNYACKCLSFLGKHSINIYLIHSFFNGIWKPTYCILQNEPILRVGGINMWILLVVCLNISIMIEYLKEKLYWNKCTNKMLSIVK